MHTQSIVTLLTLGASSLAVANTPLLVNTDFSVLDGPNVGWIAGSNSYVSGVWQNFLSLEVADRVTPSGSGFVFASLDDGFSDSLENFLFQEFGASPTTTIFSTGDVIVFKGRASATLTGADTSDLVVRAMIKTLGWGEVGGGFSDPNQPKPEYSAYQPIGTDLEEFELRVTFPDLTVDDSPTKVQIGFEIANAFDVAASSMDMATIYFEGIEAYIEGDQAEMWNGYEVLSEPDGWVDTGSAKMGWLYIRNEPYIYSLALDKTFYLDPAADFSANGNWIYVFTPPASE